MEEEEAPVGDGKLETRTKTHRLGAYEEEFACGVSKEGETGRNRDEGVM